MKFVIVLSALVAAAAAQNVASCLGGCMNEIVSLSQKVQQNGFNNLCGWYQQGAQCVAGCSQNSGWLQVGRNMESNCNSFWNTVIGKYQRCYQESLSSVSNGCDRECSGNGVSGSFWSDSNQNRYCLNNDCYMQCLSNGMNRVCEGSGTALANAYYAPYATIYNSQLFWNFYASSTGSVQPWCRGYYYGQYPGGSITFQSNNQRPGWPQNQRPRGK